MIKSLKTLTAICTLLCNFTIAETVVERIWPSFPPSEPDEFSFRMFKHTTLKPTPID